MRSLLILLLAVSCGYNHQSNTNSSVIKSSIIEGVQVNEESDAELSKAAVSMLSTIGSCSGILISKNVVLTAAHCVDGVNQSPKTVRMGTISISHESNKYQEYEVARVIPHPSFYSDQTEQPQKVDLALLILKKDVADKHVPMKILGNFDFITLGKPIEVAGFSPYSTAQRKNIADYLIEPILNKYETSNLEEGIMTRMLTTKNILDTEDVPTLEKNTFFHNQISGGMCRGDSGGPTMVRIDGIQYVIGINHAVMAGNVVSPLDCEFIGTSTSVALFKDWITDTINENGAAQADFSDAKETQNLTKSLCPKALDNIATFYINWFKNGASEKNCTDDYRAKIKTRSDELNEACSQECAGTHFEKTCEYYKNGFSRMSEYKAQRCVALSI